MAATLLLMDDSRTIHRVFELIYTGTDVSVLVESDPQAGLHRVREARPDIVVIDSGLQGTDGYEVCRLIREDPDLSRIPVLIMGSSQHPLDDARLKQCQAAGSILKPFASADLKTKVETLLRQAAQAPAVKVPVPPPLPTAVPPLTVALPSPKVVPPAPAWIPPSVPSAPPVPGPRLTEVPIPPPAMPVIPPTPAAEEAAFSKTPAMEEELLGKGPSDEDLWQIIDLEEEVPAEPAAAAAPKEAGPAPSAEEGVLSIEEEPLELSEEDLFLEEVPEEPVETKKRLDAEIPAPAALDLNPPSAVEEEILTFESLDQATAAVEDMSAGGPEEEELELEEAPAEEEARFARAGTGWYNLEAEAPPRPEAAVTQPAEGGPPVATPEPSVPASPPPVREVAPPPVEVLAAAAVRPPSAEEIIPAVRAYLQSEEGKAALERIAWDVVPDLAELIIRAEIERLKKELEES